MRDRDLPMCVVDIFIVILIPSNNQLSSVNTPCVAYGDALIKVYIYVLMWILSNYYMTR